MKKVGSGSGKLNQVASNGSGKLNLVGSGSAKGSGKVNLVGSGSSKLNKISSGSAKQ